MNKGEIPRLTMLNRILSSIRFPKYNDAEMDDRAKNLRWILFASLIITALGLSYCAIISNVTILLLTSSAFTFEIIILALEQKKRIRFAVILLPLVLWVGILGLSIIFYSANFSFLILFGLIIIIADLTIGIKGTLGFTLLSIIATVFFSILQNRFEAQLNPNLIFLHIFFYIAIFSVTALSSSTKRRALQKISQLTHNIELLDRNTISQQHNLESYSNELKEQSADFSFLTEINDMLSVNVDVNLNDTINEVVRITKKNLPIDQINIYLVDKTGLSAILTGSSENRSIPNESIDIYSADYQRQAVNKDVQYVNINEKKIFYSIPALSPGMNFQKLVPFISGGQVLGFMDIQASQIQLRPSTDTTIKTISNMIACILEKEIIQSVLNKAILEMGTLSEKAARDSWKKITAGETIGFSFDQIQVMPIDEELSKDITNRLLGSNSVSYVITGDKPGSRLISPIKIRNQVIGIIGFEDRDKAHIWGSDQVVLLEAIAGQIGLALENSRLIYEAQLNAQNEKIIGDITSSIRETLSIDTVLQKAIQEMQRNFDLRQAEIRLTSSLSEEPSQVAERDV